MKELHMKELHTIEQPTRTTPEELPLTNEEIARRKKARAKRALNRRIQVLKCYTIVAIISTVIFAGFYFIVDTIFKGLINSGIVTVAGMLGFTTVIIALFIGVKAIYYFRNI